MTTAREIADKLIEIERQLHEVSNNIEHVDDEDKDISYALHCARSAQSLTGSVINQLTDKL